MRALRLLFFFYLFIELIGVLYVANRWGVFSMFAEVIVSAFIGVPEGEKEEQEVEKLI